MRQGFSALAKAFAPQSASSRISADLNGRRAGFVTAQTGTEQQKLLDAQRAAASLQAAQQAVLNGDMTEEEARRAFASALLGTEDGLQYGPSAAMGMSTFVQPNFLPDDQFSRALLGTGVVANHAGTPSGHAADNQNAIAMNDADNQTTIATNNADNDRALTQTELDNKRAMAVAAAGNASAEGIAALDRQRALTQTDRDNERAIAVARAANENARVINSANNENAVSMNDADNVSAADIAGANNEAAAVRAAMAELAGNARNSANNENAVSMNDADNENAVSMNDADNVSAADIAKANNQHAMDMAIAGLGTGSSKPENIAAADIKILQTQLQDRLRGTGKGDGAVDPRLMASALPHLTQAFRETNGDHAAAVEIVLKLLDPQYEDKWGFWNPPRVTGTVPEYVPPAPRTPAASTAPGAVKEGTRAVNPKTGQTIVFKGGQWVLVEAGP